MERDPAPDFTRGTLVLCMVVYHAVNYASADPAVLRHLRFLPGAFVFLAGFAVGRIYLPRWSTEEAGLARRLLLRGGRLLALFLALNVAAHAAWPDSYNRRLDLTEFLARLPLILGPGGVRAAVFGVLLPIAYVLVACGAALALRHHGRRAVLILGAGTFAGATVLAEVRPLPFNLELAAFGLLGVLAGAVPSRLLPTPARHPATWVFLLASHQIVLLRGEPGFLLTTAGIIVTAAALHVIGRKVPVHRWLVAPVLLLGRHSLPAYLIQIAVLQMLFRITRATGGGPPPVGGDRPDRDPDHRRPHRTREPPLAPPRCRPPLPRPLRLTSQTGSGRSLFSTPKNKWGQGVRCFRVTGRPLSSARSAQE